MFLNMEFSYTCVIYTHTYFVHICVTYRYIYVYTHICVCTHTYTPCCDLPPIIVLPPQLVPTAVLSALILSAHNQCCPKIFYCLSIHFLHLLIVALI